MSSSGDVAVVIPAKNESDRIQATVTGAAGLPGVDLVVVVDDGSTDDTAALAGDAGATVVRHSRSHGKAAAMETGADAVQLIEPVRAGDADMTIAVFTDRVRQGGHGFVVGLSGAGIERATGWRPAQPLNGQRCLTRVAFELGRPLAAGFGVETALTIDLLNLGMRVTEVEVPLAHRATGNDWHSQVHRARQFADVARALAVRAISVRTRLLHPGRP